ncbi:MAG TPA: CAP domain-containing protein [Ktedonosporobacter sp.]|nr:CAP domain-containing protein [Ktedonosporobacter sp.]
MQRKLFYFASILPITLLCTQLIACTVDGSIYSSKPAVPAVNAANGGSVVSTTGGQAATGKIHSAPLIRADQPSTITPVAPCNTLQLPGNVAQPPFTRYPKKVLPSTVPAIRCQSAKPASGYPGNVKTHNKPQIPGTIPTKPQIPGHVPIQPQTQGASTVPARASSPLKPSIPNNITIPARSQLPSHSTTSSSPLITADPGSGNLPQKQLHPYKKNSIFAALPGQGSIIARSLFNLINRDRLAAQLPALRWSDVLAGSAGLHNLMMAHFNLLAHQLPNESPVGVRENEQRVNWTWYGENIAFNSDQTLDGAIFIYNSMMAEQPPDDDHRQNILNPQATKVGIDVLLDPMTQKMWMTEDFAAVH